MSTENKLEQSEMDKLVSEEMCQLMDRIHLSEMLIDTSIDRVMAFDTALRVITWNKTCEVLSGLPREQALGRQLFDVIPEYQSSAVVSKGIENALKGVKVFVPADEGSFGGGYFEQHFIPLKDDREEVEGVLVVVHDVAHRVKAENELKALNKSLARKNRELKQRNAELLSFAHVTGHDLKEPLRKIYTFIEMLVTGEARRLSDNGRSIFKRIQAAVQRMGILTDDILNYSQLNDAMLNLEPVDLNHTVKFVLFNLSEQIESKGAVIDLGELPIINGYRNLLAQLFQNLISNGLKSQPKEGEQQPHLWITADQVRGSDLTHPDAVPETVYHRISVRDNGIGFEKEYEDRIFQMFQRLHNATSYPGTGIGLTLCRKIAELHNGFVAAESEPGAGSTFLCYFPATAP